MEQDIIIKAIYNSISRKLIIYIEEGVSLLVTEYKLEEEQYEEKHIVFKPDTIILNRITLRQEFVVKLIKEWHEEHLAISSTNKFKITKRRFTVTDKQVRIMQIIYVEEYNEEANEYKEVPFIV